MATTVTLNLTPAADAGQGLHRRAVFLEHPSSPVRNTVSREVIAAFGPDVYRSTNLGETWAAVRVEGWAPSTVYRCFTLEDGNRVVQTQEPAATFLVDPDFNLISPCETGAHNWHGTWSVDQSAAGVVMYAEYASATERLHVWRSKDGGRNWDTALEIRGMTGAREDADARHFHTCQADPHQPGRWIVSTGDHFTHCRVWISDDEGDRWTEAPAPVAPPGIIAPRRARQLLRYTAVIFEPDVVCWPTDDLLERGQAGLVVADRAEPTRIRAVLPLGPNEMRSYVRIDDRFGLAIAQAKHDTDRAEVFLTEDWRSVIPLPAIESPDGAASAFTRSVCSRMAVDGVFFSFDDSGFAGYGCRTARWELTFRTRSPSPAEAPDGGCNICAPGAEQRIAEGFPEEVRREGDPEGYQVRGGVREEYVCPVCKSRGRIRALHTLLAQARGFLPTDGSLLLVSGNKQEQRFLSKAFREVVHVSLVGDHDDPNCILGVDIRDMHQVETGRFDAAIAAGVLDYVPELDKALREVARVLKPGGVFLFYIQPYRVVDDPRATVRVTHHNALAHEAYAPQQGGQTGIPNCVFGRDWIKLTARRTGFAIDDYPLQDSASELRFTWFMARRLPDKIS